MTNQPAEVPTPLYRLGNEQGYNCDQITLGEQCIATMPGLPLHTHVDELESLRASEAFREEIALAKEIVRMLNDHARLERENIALLTALQNVVARLEWAHKFTGALTDTGNELDGGKLFVLNYDEANWDNADEWRPVALRHLTAARAAIKSATEEKT